MADRTQRPRIDPAVRSASAGESLDRPRFDLRFETGRGLLKLARSLRTELGEIEALELALGVVKFPLDVAGGAGRFRTRKTRVRTARVRVDFRALERAAAGRGVKLAIAGASSAGAGALDAAVTDELGVLAGTVRLVADGGDLLLVVRDVRAAADAPATPDERLARVLRKLALVLDEDRGAWRVPRPARRLLALGLVTRGWRLPDERGAELAPPVVENGAIVLPIGLHAAEDPARLRADAAALDDARELKVVTAALAVGEVARADGALRAIERRLADRPGSASSLRLRAVSLRQMLEAESTAGSGGAPGRTSAGSLVVGGAAGGVRGAAGDEPAGVASTDASAAAARHALWLRAALRTRDVKASARAARSLADVEPCADLAVDALAGAARLCAEESPRLAMELLGRALARRPDRLDLALRSFEVASEAGDAEAVEGIAARAMGGARGDGERASIAVGAARALERLGASAAATWWDEAVGAAPDDAEAIAGRAGALDRAGDPERAREGWDRAAERWLAKGDRRRAARARGESARLLVALGRPESSEPRLEEATRLDPAAVAHVVALARVRASLGAVKDASAAYRRLLLPDVQGDPGLADALAEAARVELDRLDRDGGDAAGLGAEARLDLGDHAAARDLVDALARTSESHPDLAALRARSQRASAVAVVAEPERIEEAAVAAPEMLDAIAAEVEATTDPAERVERVRRAADALRAAGRAGDAVILMARTGAAARDTGLLRAAIELAERAGAWDAAAHALDLALEVVGSGPARAALLERRASIESKRR